MRKLALILAALATLGVAPRPVSQTKPVPASAGLALQSPSAILVEASTGQVLYEQGADREAAPASMTKLMTLHLALKAVAQHRARLADPVAVSENAWRTAGSQIWLEPGETLPLGQLLRAVAIGSANDGCVAIAEHLAGSEEAFVQQMNAEARRLGMHHTHYANSHGLDAEGHLTSARDMATLARAVLQDRGLLALTSQREDRTIRDGKGGHLWLVNHNRLLGKVLGVDGLKTGYTHRAGFCLTATALREGLRLVAVVMGGPNSKARFSDAQTLLEHGFRNYQAVLLARRGQVLGEVAVAKGMQGRVRVAVQRDLLAVRPRGQELKVRLRPVLPERVKAPVQAGRPLGRAVVMVGSERVASVPLVAQSCVPRATMAGLLRRLTAGILRF